MSDPTYDDSINKQSRLNNDTLLIRPQYYALIALQKGTFRKPRRPGRWSIPLAPKPPSFDCRKNLPNPVGSTSCSHFGCIALHPHDLVKDPCHSGIWDCLNQLVFRSTTSHQTRVVASLGQDSQKTEIRCLEPSALVFCCLHEQMIHPIGKR